MPRRFSEGFPELRGDRPHAESAFRHPPEAVVQAPGTAKPHRILRSEGPRADRSCGRGRAARTSFGSERALRVCATGSEGPRGPDASIKRAARRWQRRAAFDFTVDVPPSQPDVATALGDALSQTGGLFDRCTPDTAGTQVIGSIPSPLGSEPALDAKCWAGITSHPGFYVIDLSFVSPSSLPITEIPVGPSFVHLPKVGSSEAARYGYVVSSLGATSYDTTTEYRTASSDNSMFSYYWEGESWDQHGPGPCGVWGFRWARSAVWMAMITACPG